MARKRTGVGARAAERALGHACSELLARGRARGELPRARATTDFGAGGAEEGHGSHAKHNMPAWVAVLGRGGSALIARRPSAHTRHERNTRTSHSRAPFVCGQSLHLEDCTAPGAGGCGT